MRIGVDIDGTICNFRKGFFERARKKYGGMGRLEDILRGNTKMDFSDVLTLEHVTALFGDLWDDLPFWAELEPLDGTSLLRTLCAKHQVTFYTARKYTSGMHREILLWLENRFNVTGSAEIIIDDKDKVKWMNDLDAYIDDDPSILTRVAEEWPKTKLFLRDQPNNRQSIDLQETSIFPVGCTRVATFDEFAAKILGSQVSNTKRESAPQLFTSHNLRIPPKRQHLLDRHKELCAAAHSLMEKKNQDYASDNDPFRNFRMAGRKGIPVRLGDKVARLMSFCERGDLKVSDESVEDTVLDIINYAILFHEYKE